MYLISKFTFWCIFFSCTYLSFKIQKIQKVSFYTHFSLIFTSQKKIQDFSFWYPKSYFGTLTNGNLSVTIQSPILITLLSLCCPLHICWCPEHQATMAKIDLYRKWALRHRTPHPYSKVPNKRTCAIRNFFVKNHR